MSNPRIAYAPRPDATPEGELNALAACYRLILDSAKKRGRLLDKGSLDDVKGFRNDSRHKHHIR
jgi:hypothetical protein